MADQLLRAENMTVGYGGVPLIRDIALSVSGGEILSLVGPNGSGKSTILKSLIRELALLGGTVYLDGRDSSRLSAAETARTLAVMMTGRIAPERMTCWDVAAAGRYPYTGRLGILGAEDREKVCEALALVHAEELADRDFTCISDGQRQRVLLARAICQQPRVLILDEPTSFLDIRYKLELLTILKNLVRERSVAVVLSLHELDLAQKISDRVICVANGEIARVGTPEEVFTDGSVQRLYGLTAGSYDGARRAAGSCDRRRRQRHCALPRPSAARHPLRRRRAARERHGFPGRARTRVRDRLRTALSAHRGCGAEPCAGAHARLPLRLRAAPYLRPDE